jgi:hypothetical protein
MQALFARALTTAAKKNHPKLLQSQSLESAIQRQSRIYWKSIALNGFVPVISPYLMYADWLIKESANQWRKNMRVWQFVTVQFFKLPFTLARTVFEICTQNYSWTLLGGGGGVYGPAMVYLSKTLATEEKPSLKSLV